MAPTRATLTDREQAELIRGLYRSAPVGVAGALFGVAVLCWVLIYIEPASQSRVEVWLAFTVAIAAWQLVLCARYAWARGPDKAWRVWARRFVLVSLAEGVRWGVGSLVLAQPGHPEQQIWVCMVVACAASSSVSSLGSYIPAFYALLFPAMLPFCIWGFLQDDPRYWALALLSLVLMTSIALLGFGQSRSLASALRQRFENLDLAEDLRHQKELAEKANLAKTQFLAAASHDLRQPIHALGMFVDALGRRRMDGGTKLLANQISETVATMAGQFDSLLDVSQLDAGVVQPKAQTFAIQPLLDRVCREQMATLEGGPVVLRQVRTSAIAHTDPVLLERIVRNLVANAVHYTRTGKILVGCRRGDRTAIEVWDSGPGIADADQEHIFEEYYQLGNAERSRAKGLGLGLAIARRLSLLIDCPITLRSRVGRGSVFRVSVQCGVASAGVEPAKSLAVPAAKRDLVFFVDDEQAIQRGTADLLEHWGYQVVTAASAAELRAKISASMRPDLVICDWRLNGEETALAITGLIAEIFGPGIPALLITGETSASRLRDAQAAGFIILHKPLLPGKLRAAVGNLIRRSLTVDPNGEAVI
jgi:signal transduction histidine kinase